MKPVLRAVLAAVLGSLVVSMLVLSTSATAAPHARSGATTILKPPTQFGVSYGERLTRMSPADMATALDDATGLGVGWIRMDFSWTSLQPDGPSSYRWGPVDRVVKAAHARGLHVLPILTWTPVWARNLGCLKFSCPPRKATEFARFAKAAVARYKGRGVHTWELWNEPNLAGFWPNPNPTRYATLLKTTFRGIRSVDPKATVLLGGLSALERRAPSIGPRQFLRAVCQAGACGSMSGVSYHPYTYPYPASRYGADSAWSKISQTPTSLRSILTSFGFPKKRIWVTEYGAPTKGAGTAANNVNTILPTTTHVTEAWQAVLATDVVGQAVLNRSVRALFWYTNQDLSNTSLRESSFGLKRLDGSRKPAWSTFGTAVRSASLG